MVNVGTAGRRSKEAVWESFIERTEPLPWTGCLIWTGGRTGADYGTMWVDGRAVPAHRYAWEHEHGPIPGGVMIDHRYHCDRACCEVSHLREATAAENSRHRAGANRRSGTGVRNVVMHRAGRYRVVVRKDGQTYGRTHRTIGAATAEAKGLRERLFGEFAGEE